MYKIQPVDSMFLGALYIARVAYSALGNQSEVHPSDRVNFSSSSH